MSPKYLKNFTKLLKKSEILANLKGEGAKDIPGEGMLLWSLNCNSFHGPSK